MMVSGAPLLRASRNTRAFAPLLGVDPGLAGPKGRIVNISSVGGKIGPPFLGAYAAALVHRRKQLSRPRVKGSDAR